MDDCAEKNTACEHAIISVESTHYLMSRSLYILAGTIESGILRPGMKIELDLHSGLVIALDLHGVEFMRVPQNELVALTVKVECAEQLEFMDALDPAGEKSRVAPATGDARSGIEIAAL
jgi:hypothetical protein